MTTLRLAIMQPPVLDDILRQFHGGPGVVLLFLILLVIALVFAAILTVGNFGITKAPHITKKPLVDDRARERALSAINRHPLPVRHWQEPAAKGFKGDVAHDQHVTTEALAYARSDRQ